MYTAVFFDIDDTLLDFNLCSRQALKQAFKRFSLDFNNEIYCCFQNIDSKLWAQQKLGILSVSDVLRLRFIQFTQEQNLNGLEMELKSAFEEELSDTDILFPNAKSTLEILSKRYRLFTASNGLLQMQQKRLSKADILGNFEDLYVSDEIGFEKPDINFFKKCLERCRIDPRKILFVGDSIESDINGARNAGIDTCWYNPKKLPCTEKCTHMIADLSELCEILH